MSRFQHIEYLFGLFGIPLLAGLFYLLIQWKKRAAARMGDPVLVDQLVKNFSPFRFFIKFGLALLAFILIVIGAGNPQAPGGTENVQRQGVDVMFVLDVSKSMLARDSKPDRLERAKQLLIRLLDKLENDRIGLILFAGRPYMQMPLTSDHGAARMYIEQAAPSVVPTQGTDIADALRMANSAFNSKERKYKAIVLVSDGEDHDPDAIKACKTLAQDGVMINAVGIGSVEGSPIVDPTTGELKKDADGQVVISKLNESELKQLTDLSNGIYIHLDNMDDALITLSQQLDRIDKKSLNDSEFIDYKSYFQWFLVIALLVLLIEYLLPERKPEKKMRIDIKSPVYVLLLLGAAMPAKAQKTDALIRSGNRYYKQKQTAQSQKEYEEALKQAPDDPTANYNLGDAQFRQNNFDGAAKSYDASSAHSPDSSLRENGLYNAGVAYLKGQKLQEGIQSWEDALKINPADQEARENLEKALRELKRQQQQQQRQKNQPQKKPQQPQKDQQNQQQPQPSRLTKQQAEQLLKSLEEKENEAREKLNQNKVQSSDQPDKDW